MINRVSITNYRVFETFSFLCNDDLNIIVGDNESGKSTILEAINLALTKRLNGRYVDSELTPHLFNQSCVAKYVAAVRRGENPALPFIRIEVYLNERPDIAKLRGTNNDADEDCHGVALEISFDETHREDYEQLLRSTNNITTVPIEYYRASWYSFANSPISARDLHLRTSFIDATTIRLQSGTDYYLNSIIKDGLDRSEQLALALAYRRLKELFSEEDSIKAINAKLTGVQGILTDKTLAVGMDFSPRGAWETSLTPHLDTVPYEFIGKGEQNVLKIMLALNRKDAETHVVLIEEPENHLSFSRMGMLLKKVMARCKGKQLFLTTHSAYVLNKLGIGKVGMLANSSIAYLTDLDEGTQDYFRRLSGYDTLRLILAKRVILVEGPSDDLIVQKAYKLRHGRLPLEDGIDVISVRGLSFTRFLDIAHLLDISATVVTDNDGKYEARVKAKYQKYLGGRIKVCSDTDDSLPTLEDHLVACNSLDALNVIFATNHATPRDMLEYMKANKTDCALALFDTKTDVTIPAYVVDAVT